MRTYVVFDNKDMQYVSTVYQNSISTSSYRTNAIECETLEQANALKSMSISRQPNHKFVVRCIETTEKDCEIPEEPK